MEIIKIVDDIDICRYEVDGIINFIDGEKFLEKIYLENPKYHLISSEKNVSGNVVFFFHKLSYNNETFGKKQREEMKEVRKFLLYALILAFILISYLCYNLP